MSHVTNVILTFPLMLMEDEKEFLEKHLYYQDGQRTVAFWPVDSDENDPSSGTKALEINVCVGAFNNLDIPLLIEKVKAVPWPKLTNVQLFIQDENEDVFTERLHAS